MSLNLININNDILSEILDKFDNTDYDDVKWLCNWNQTNMKFYRLVKQRIKHLVSFFKYKSEFQLLGHWEAVLSGDIRIIKYISSKYKQYNKFINYLNADEYNKIASRHKHACKLLNIQPFNYEINIIIAMRQINYDRVYDLLSDKNLIEEYKHEILCESTRSIVMFKLMWNLLGDGIPDFVIFTKSIFYENKEVSKFIINIYKENNVLNTMINDNMIRIIIDHIRHYRKFTIHKSSLRILYDLSKNKSDILKYINNKNMWHDLNRIKMIDSITNINYEEVFDYLYLNRPPGYHETIKYCIEKNPLLLTKINVNNMCITDINFLRILSTYKDLKQLVLSKINEILIHYKYNAY